MGKRWGEKRGWVGGGVLGWSVRGGIGGGVIRGGVKGVVLRCGELEVGC